MSEVYEESRRISQEMSDFLRLQEEVDALKGRLKARGRACDMARIGLRQAIEDLDVAYPAGISPAEEARRYLERSIEMENEDGATKNS
jgi:hypothetical protein